MSLIDALFKRLTHYAKLDEGIGEALGRLPVAARHFEAGETVIAQGDESETAFAVAAGWAARTIDLSNGRSQIVNFMLPGDVFDLQVLVDRPADHQVKALTPLTIACLGRDALLDVLRSRSPLVPALWWASVQEEGILREQVVRNGRRSARERVAHMLLELEERLAVIGEAAEHGFSLAIGQSSLADALGLSYVHVSRVMSYLEREGLIERRRSLVRIKNREKLQEMCDFSVLYLHGGKGTRRLVLGGPPGGEGAGE